MRSWIGGCVLLNPDSDIPSLALSGLTIYIGAVTLLAAVSGSELDEIFSSALASPVG